MGNFSRESHLACTDYRACAIQECEDFQQYLDSNIVFAEAENELPFGEPPLL
jgi:hypothetical protein